MKVSAIPGCEGRCIQGIVSAESRDGDNEIMVQENLYKSLNKTLKRNMSPITVLHAPKPVGRWLMFLKTRIKNKYGKMIPAIRGIGQLFDDQHLATFIWDKIKSHEIDGLSVNSAGPSKWRVNEDGKLQKYLISREAYEVTLTPAPKVKEALIEKFNEHVKSDDTGSMANISKQLLSYIMSESGTDTQTDLKEQLKSEIMAELLREMQQKGEGNGDDKKDDKKDDTKKDDKKDDEKDDDQTKSCTNAQLKSILEGQDQLRQMLESQTKSNEPENKPDNKPEDTKYDDQIKALTNNQQMTTKVLAGMQDQMKSMADALSDIGTEHVTSDPGQSQTKSGDDNILDGVPLMGDPLGPNEELQEFMKSVKIMAHPALGQIYKIIEKNPKMGLKNVQFAHWRGAFRGYRDHGYNMRKAKVLVKKN